MLQGFSDISSLTCTTRILLVNYLQLAQFSSGTSTKFKHCFVGFFFSWKAKGNIINRRRKTMGYKNKNKKRKISKNPQTFCNISKKDTKNCLYQNSAQLLPSYFNLVLSGGQPPTPATFPPFKKKKLAKCPKLQRNAFISVSPFPSLSSSSLPLPSTLLPFH